MGEKILFVDDEPNVLQSIKRSLRKQFTIETAEGGQAALEMLSNNGPYAVIVSDMKMPGMNGVEFLCEAKKRTPDSVRMMLTGNADQETAVAAVNEGDVYRFLNKPCDPEKIAAAVNLALGHHRLITAERELLEKTLRGSIQALAEVLSLTSPEVFGRTTRLKTYMRKLADALDATDTWRLETAALLSQIGCVTVPAELVRKRAAGAAMSADEILEFQKHTVTGAQLLSAIPRMEEIAQCILYQEKNYDGSGFPDDGISGDDIPYGARLLRVIIDFDAFESNSGKSKALAQIKQQAHCYDPAVLGVFEQVLEQEAVIEPSAVKLSDLTDRMMLAENVFTTAKVMLVPKGQETTESVRRHLRNFFEKNLIGETVVVWRDSQ